MEELYKHLTEITKYPLSNHDIDKLYNIPIIVPEQINKILSKKRGQWIVFLENDNSNVGHWVLLSKTPNSWEYFDSYGRPPPRIVSRYFQNIPLTYNTVRYQGEGRINTCGFHVLFRAFTQKFMNFDLNEYREFMRTPKEHDKAVIFYVTNYVSKTK